MRLQEAGAIPQNNERYLAHDWHKRLTPRQLEAYIRYVFIALKTHAYDLDSAEHKTTKLRWDGGKDYHGNNYKRVWNRIADRINRHDSAFPGIWIAAHFSPTFHAVRVAENKGFIDNRPELLVSDLSFDIYCRYVDTFSALATQRCMAAEMSVATQLKMLENVIADPDDRVFYIVADKTNVNATPFFRHAFAAVSGCARGVTKYQMAAAIEYDINQSLYDDLITRPENDWWVCDDLRNVVAQHRKYWSEHCHE